MDPMDEFLTSFSKLISEKRVAEAEALASATIECSDDPHAKSLALSHLAYLRVKEKRLPEAVELHLRAEKIFPDDPHPKISTAYTLLYFLGDHEAAIKKLDEAISLEKQPGWIKHQAEQLKGEMALSRGDTSQAAGHLLESLEIQDWSQMAAPGPEFILVGHLIDRNAELETCETYLSKIHAWAESQKVTDRLFRLPASEAKLQARKA